MNQITKRIKQSRNNSNNQINNQPNTRNYYWKNQTIQHATNQANTQPIKQEVNQCDEPLNWKLNQSKNNQADMQSIKQAFNQPTEQNQSIDQTN